MATTSQTAPYDRYRISESRSLLFIPGGSANRLDLGLNQPVSHQRDHREQSEERRRRSSNRQIASLALSFYFQMNPRLYEGHFHSPAPNEPTQDLQRRMIEIGRQQGLRFTLTRRIADQHPTNWDRHISTTIPDCRLGIDFDFTPLSAVPVCDLNLRPFRFRNLESLLRRRCDQSDPWRTAHQVKQIKRGKATIAHKNQISTRQEACDQFNDLPGAVGHPLMPTLALGVAPLRWAKHCQEWQPPDATGPGGDRDQQHATQPPQPTCLDKVRVRGANWFAVDPLALIFLPRLRSIVSSIQITNSPPGAKLAGSKRNKMRLAAKDDHRAVQDQMVVDEALLLAQPHEPQASGNSSSAKRQHSSDQQDFGMLPDQLGEQGRKLYNQRQQFGRAVFTIEDLSWKKWSSAQARACY